MYLLVMRDIERYMFCATSSRRAANEPVSRLLSWSQDIDSSAIVNCADAEFGRLSVINLTDDALAETVWLPKRNCSERVGSTM